MYTWVVSIDACPSISWTLRRSQPPSIRWVANECRSVCGVTSLETPAPAGVVAHQLEHRLAGDPAPAMVQEEDVAALGAAQVRPAARKVRARSLDGALPHRDDPLLRALAHAPHETLVEVDVRDAQRDELRDPEAGAVEELQHRPVAQAARGAVGSGDDRLGLSLGERLRERSAEPREAARCGLRRRGRPHVRGASGTHARRPGGVGRWQARGRGRAALLLLLKKKKKCSIGGGWRLNGSTWEAVLHAQHRRRARRVTRPSATLTPSAAQGSAASARSSLSGEFPSMYGSVTFVRPRRRRRRHVRDAVMHDVPTA